MTEAAAEELVVEFASPLYVAVIEYVPTARLDLLSVAVPATRDAVPRLEVPFLKVTVPVGAGPEDVTMALRVSG